MNVSIIMPLYKYNEEILKKILEVVKKQKFKGKVEVIKVDKEMGLAESLNYGIKKSKYQIVVSLHQDCIPSDENWLQKLVNPFKDKEVILSVSKVHLPEELWNKFDIFAKVLTLKEKGTLNPTFDGKGCAYRKKILLDVGLFNEKDFRTGGEDADMDIKLNGKGKIFYPDCTVIHMHSTNLKARLKKIKLSANSTGTLIRIYGLNVESGYLALLYSIPLIGMFFQALSYPFNKGLRLYPVYLLVMPLAHYAQVIGFWKGFISKKQTIRSY